MSDEPAVVAVDRFPVNVVTSDLVLREVKVIMTEPVDGVGRLVVWSSPEQVALDTSYYPAESDIRSTNQADWTVQTADGVVVIQSMHGCGCGNRLKMFRPAEFATHKLRRGSRLR
jgi:hypothetical protein